MSPDKPRSPASIKRAEKQARDAKIFNLHAKGYSVGAIVKLFVETLKEPLTSQSVYKIIAKQRRINSILAEADRKEAREILLSRSEARNDQLLELTIGADTKTKLRILQMMQKEDEYQAGLSGAPLSLKVDQNIPTPGPQTPAEALRQLLDLVDDPRLREQVKGNYDRQLSDAGFAGAAPRAFAPLLRPAPIETHPAPEEPPTAFPGDPTGEVNELTPPIPDDGTPPNSKTSTIEESPQQNGDGIPSEWGWS